MQYDYLDDVPHSVRMRIQDPMYQASSPTPSHFSIVTNNTPSPQPQHQQTHNQQVMSPNPTQHSVSTSSITTHQQATSHPSHQTVADMQVDATGARMRQMTQVDIPAHVLEQFRQGIQLDTTVLDDVRAAIVELSDRVQFRTQALGDATINLHTGFVALQQQVETLREALQVQSQVVEKTIARQEDDLQSLRRIIMDDQGKHNSTAQRLDANVQREALLEAKLSSLDGKFEELRTHLAGRQETVAAQVHKLVQDTAETDQNIGLLHGELKRLYQVEDAVHRLEGSSSSDAAGQTMAEVKSEDLGALRATVENLANMLQETRDNQDPDWRVVMQQEFQSLVEAQQTQDARMSALQEQVQKLAVKAPSVFQMSPNAAAELPESGAMPQRADEGNASEWYDAFDWCDTPQFGISEPPPPLPPGLSVSATAPASSGEPAMLEGKSEKQDGGKVQWKVLWDMPGFDWGGNKTPWELGMAYSTWRRQVCTVAGTVGSRFQLYVEKCFVDAERRYQQKSRDETQNPLTGYDAFPSDYEGRFVVQLLKVLPDRVKTPAMEMSAATTTLHPAFVIEELVGQIQPGGCEEQTSLTRFVRSLEPVATATEGIHVLRRWRLARSRIQALGLPEAAPFELLRGLQVLVSRLEKKHESLKTRMSICRLESSVQLGQPKGVDIILEQIDKELRMLAADEATKANAAGHHDDPTAHKGLGKGKEKGKGKSSSDRSQIVCPFLSKPGGCTFGDRCHYKHPDATNPLAPNPKGKATPDPAKQRKCMFHNRKGGCKLGNKCKFLHEGPGFAEAAAAQEDNSLVGSGGAPAAKAKPGATAKASAVSAMSFVGKVQSTGETYYAQPSSCGLRSEAINPNASAAHDGHTGVLVDSGANEIVRTVHALPRRTSQLTLTLANGDTVQAARSRDGEVIVVVPREQSLTTICGATRLIQVGCRFQWSDDGAWLLLTVDEEQEWIHLEVINGLPYLPWSVFSRIRPAMTKWWKDNRSSPTVTAISAGGNTTIPQAIAPNIMPHLTCSAEGADLAEAKARDLLDGGQDAITCESVYQLIKQSQLPPQTKHRAVIEGDDATVTAWTFGFWSHGGKSGITTITKQRPALTKVLTCLARKLAPTLQWVSMTIHENLTFIPHRDLKNLQGSSNFLVCVSGPLVCSGGELWTENPCGTETRKVKPGVELPGVMHDIIQKPLVFDASRWHGTSTWQGDRVTLGAYTPEGIRRAAVTDLMMLRELGFPTPQLSSTVCARSEATEAAVFNGAHQATPEGQAQPPQSPNASTGDVGFGHQDYWDDVCEAQAGRDVGQDLGLLEFGVDFGESSGTSHDRPVTAEAVVISDDDQSIDLSEIPDLSAELPEKNDDDEIRKRTFHQLAAQGLRHPHRKVRPEDIALGSLAIDVAGPYKEGFGGFRYALIGVFTFQHAGPGLSFVKLLRHRKLDTILTATEQILSHLMYLGRDRSPVVRLHSENALEFVAERFSTEINNKGIFKTVTVPHNPASNGRAERQVQALKRAALQFLLEGHLERRFWPQCLLEAAACQRDAVLNVRVSKKQ